MKSAYYLLFIFFFLLTTHADSQSLINIGGVVVDSLTSKPLPYCTISLIPIGTRNKLKTTSNKDGQFTFKIAKHGNIQMIFDVIGYKSRFLTLSTDVPVIGDTVRLTQTIMTLKQVNIMATKPLITQKTDRFVYDVHGDKDNKILSALEIMRKVPLLSIDADDKIKLNVQDNYKILINGKPSVILDIKSSDYLKAMLASGIAKIEVITVPSAKYESEGLAGIINIITEKKVLDGYDGSLGAATDALSDQTSRSASGIFNLKSGKFGASASFGTALDKPKQDITIDRHDLKDNLNHLTQSISDRFRSPYTHGSLELNYQADTLDLFTIQFNLYEATNNITDQTQTAIFNNNLLTQGFASGKESKENYHVFSYAFNYEHGFKHSKTKFLTFSYRHSDYPDALTDYVSFDNQFNSSQQNLIQYNNQVALEHTAQIDYTFPIKKVIVDVGTKGIFRTNKSNYQDLISPPGTISNNDFYNKQNVYSLYNTYSFTLGAWSVKAGVRLENTVIHAYSSSSVDTISYSCWTLSPSVAFQKPLKNQASLSLGYTQRITRPSIVELNTFIDRSNPYIQTTGNFSLHPAIGHNISASYSKFGVDNFIAGISYFIQTNIIQKVTTYNSTTNISSISYENLGKDESLGINLYYKHSFSKNVTIDFNGNVSQVWISGPVENLNVHNNGLNAYITSSPSWNLKNGYRLIGSFSYERPRITLQQVSNNNVSTYVGVSKSYFNNNLSVSLFAYNPFQRYRTLVRNLTGNSFAQSSTIELYYRKFTARLSYKFGKITNPVKKVKKTIYNDDVPQ